MAKIECPVYKKGSKYKVSTQISLYFFYISDLYNRATHIHHNIWPPRNLFKQFPSIYNIGSEWLKTWCPVYEKVQKCQVYTPKIKYFFSVSASYSRATYLIHWAKQTNNFCKIWPALLCQGSMFVCVFAWCFYIIDWCVLAIILYLSSILYYNDH